MRIYMASFDTSKSSDWKSQVSDPTSPSYDLSSEYSRLSGSPTHIIQSISDLKINELNQFKNEFQELLVNFITNMRVLEEQISTLINKLDLFGSKIDRISKFVISNDNSMELNNIVNGPIIDLLFLEVNNFLRLKMGEKIEESKIQIDISEYNDEEIVFTLHYDINTIDNETLLGVIETLNEFGFLIDKDVIIENL